MQKTTRTMNFKTMVSLVDFKKSIKSGMNNQSQHIVMDIDFEKSDKKNERARGAVSFTLRDIETGNIIKDEYIGDIIIKKVSIMDSYENFDTIKDFIKNYAEDTFQMTALYNFELK